MATKNVILKDSSSNELRPETVLTQVKDASGNDLFTQTSGVISTTTGNSINGASINDASIGAAKLIKSELVNLIYPVGAIYISTSNTTPATLFGGTWQQIKDKFLLSAGDTYTAGSTGGDATHTHDAGTIKAKISVHTANEMDAQFGSADSWWAATNTIGISSYSNQTRTHGDAINCAGTSGSASSLPPYLTVYMWKRTA